MLGPVSSYSTALYRTNPQTNGVTKATNADRPQEIYSITGQFYAAVKLTAYSTVPQVTCLVPPDCGTRTWESIRVETPQSPCGGGKFTHVLAVKTWLSRRHEQGHEHIKPLLGPEYDGHN
jgi:hypothetical protein